MRAVVYSRVSTDAQERDGTSLDTQERLCLDYAREVGWQVCESIQDTASGFSLDRRGISRVRELIRCGVADVVISYAVDRLSRNQVQLAVLLDEADQAGVRLEFVTEKFEDTAIGRMILNLRAFAAELEREKIVERTTRGKAAVARSGRLPQGTGAGLYGYRYNRETGQREIEPVQAEVVQRIFREFVQGSAIVSIANHLNAEGIPTMTGRSWYPATLHHLMRNEAYTGRTMYRRLVVKQVRDPRTGKRRQKREQRDEGEWIEIVGATPAIIDLDLFHQAQRRLDDPERLRQGRRIYGYALSGRVECLKCGRSMVGQTLRKKYRYYRCRRAFAGPRHDRCDTVYVSADALESVVRKSIAEALADPSIFLAEWRRSHNETAGNEWVEGLQKQLESLEGQKRRLVRLYQLGEIDDSYFENESRLLRVRRSAIEEKLGQQRSIPEEPQPEALQEACERVRDYVQQSTGDDFGLIADAVQLRVRAEKYEAELLGVLPEEYARTDDHADVRSMVIDWAHETDRPLVRRYRCSKRQLKADRIRGSALDLTLARRCTNVGPGRSWTPKRAIRRTTAAWSRASGWWLCYAPSWPTASGSFCRPGVSGAPCARWAGAESGRC